MKKNNRVRLFLSSLLLIIGSFLSSFTFVIYPMLVPSYGGGEPFFLASYNNYTDTFPWYSNSKLHLTINANATVQIYIDGENIYNGHITYVTCRAFSF